MTFRCSFVIGLTWLSDRGVAVCALMSCPSPGVLALGSRRPGKAAAGFRKPILPLLRNVRNVPPHLNY